MKKISRIFPHLIDAAHAIQHKSIHDYFLLSYLIRDINAAVIRLNIVTIIIEKVSG